MPYGFTPIWDPQARVSTEAFGINDGGKIVGAYHKSSLITDFFGFLDVNGTFTDINDPLAIHGGPFETGTSAFGINDLDQIVGSYRGFDRTHGFIESGGTYTTLDDPAADTGSSPGFTV